MHILFGTNTITSTLRSSQKPTSTGQFSTPQKASLIHWRDLCAASGLKNKLPQSERYQMVANPQQILTSSNTPVKQAKQ